MEVEDSIILFKSTSRPEYRRLVLSGLGAPSGAYFWTYYKKEHPSPDLVREAETSPSSFKGKKATLIFFNRNPDAEMRFFPIRDFTIRKIEIDGALILHLRPDEYYEYTSHELRVFNEQISEEMYVLPPSESSWAQFFTLRCLDKLHKSSDQNVWEKLVGQLDRAEIGENRCSFAWLF